MFLLNLSVNKSPISYVFHVCQPALALLAVAVRQLTFRVGRQRQLFENCWVLGSAGGSHAYTSKVVRIVRKLRKTDYFSAEQMKICLLFWKNPKFFTCSDLKTDQFLSLSQTLLVYGRMQPESNHVGFVEHCLLLSNLQIQPKLSTVKVQRDFVCIFKQ